MFMTIRLNGVARPHPDSFDTLAEFFAAFAEWERFYEPWEKRKSTRSKRGYIAWNPKTEKPAYGKQADKVLAPRKTKPAKAKGVAKQKATKVKPPSKAKATKPKPKVEAKKPKAAKPVKTKTPPVTKVPPKAKARVVSIPDKMPTANRAEAEDRRSHLEAEEMRIYREEKAKRAKIVGKYASMVPDDYMKHVASEFVKVVDAGNSGYKKGSVKLGANGELLAYRGKKFGWQPATRWGHEFMQAAQDTGLPHVELQSRVYNELRDGDVEPDESLSSQENELHYIYARNGSQMVPVSGPYSTSDEALADGDRISRELSNRYPTAWIDGLSFGRTSDKDVQNKLSKVISERGFPTAGKDAATTQKENVNDKKGKTMKVAKAKAGTKPKAKSKAVDRSDKQVQLGNDIIKYVNDVYALSPSSNKSLREVYQNVVGSSGATIGEFEDVMRDLWENDKIHLIAWTEPLYRIKNEEFSFIADKEIRFYARRAENKTKPVEKKRYERADPAWKDRLVETVKKSKGEITLKDIYKSVAEQHDVSLGQFHQGLRELASEGKISLNTYHDALYKVREENYLLVHDKQIKHSVSAKEDLPGGAAGNPVDRSKEQTHLVNSIMQAIESVNAASPSDASTLSDIYNKVGPSLGVTRGEYQDAIRHLWRNGHVRLVAWTRPLPDMRGNDDEFSVIIDGEIRNYARTTSSDKKPSGMIKIPEYARPSEETTRLWKSQLVDRIGSNSIPIKNLYEEIAKPLGVTLGQFHDGLRDLSKKRKISLSPWTKPLYAMQNEEFALLDGREIRHSVQKV